MSWQDYITTLQSQGVVDAGIYGADGNPWATSSNADVMPDEVKFMASSIEKKAFPTNGVNIGGKKYICLRMNDPENSILGRCKQEHFVAIKCKQCLIVAKGNENVQPGTCCKAAGRIAEYLVHVGY